MKIIPLLLFLVLAAGVMAQENKLVLRQEKAMAIVDTGIAAQVREVSADSIRKYIRTLAGFHTRHSLSDTTSDTRGIGAARRWVASKFREFATAHGASLRVELDPFSVSPNPRSPRVPIPPDVAKDLKVEQN